LAAGSTGYLGLNVVGFYLLKARKVFLFLGERNGLAMQCHVLSDVPPTEIAKRLSECIGFDPRWLLTIMAAAPNRTSSVDRWPRRTESPSGIELLILCHANTFPPTEAKLRP
jgi:hypothetical protein